MEKSALIFKFILGYVGNYYNYFNTSYSGEQGVRGN